MAGQVLPFSSARRLLLAIQDGNVDALRAYLDSGMSPNLSDDDGLTLLMAALSLGEHECARLLRERGAALEQTDHAGHTALMWAAMHLDLDAIDWLLTEGANVHAQTDDGCGLLHLLAMVDPEYDASAAACALSILASAVDVDHTSHDGVTALHITAENSLPHLAGVLIDAEATVNSIAQDGRSPLSDAAEEGCEALVTLLLAHGADPTVRDDRGMSPDELAYAGGYPAIAHLIEAAIPPPTPPSASPDRHARSTRLRAV